MHAKACQIRICKFEIRQENVDDVSDRIDYLGQGIPTAIIDKRDGNAGLAQFQAKFPDMGPEMIRGDKIQVVDAFVNEGFGNSKQFPGGNRFPCAVHGDLIVLAEKTTAGASAEKNCAGPMSPGK